MNHIKTALEDAALCLNLFLTSSDHIKKIEQSIRLMYQSIERGGKIFSCGNGGSLCDAMHFAEELTGRFRKDRPALPGMAISDPAHMSCVSNDYGYDYVFSRVIDAFAKKEDVLLAISTSGNSPNVIKAIESAKAKGCKVVALLGKGGGKIAPMADISLIVPSDISDRIQEIHIKIIHIFIEGIERQLFPQNYAER